MPELLTQNDKMKKASVRTFNFGIPAHVSKSGELICVFAKECIYNCYAKEGAYRWPAVANAYEYRYETTKSPLFPEIMTAEIKKKKAKAIRIHDSGDFYCVEYVLKWLEIMKALPDVQFYAYTKSIPFFDGLDIPSNFQLIFSNGGKIQVSDTDRHSQVFNTLEDLLDAGYVDASQDDTEAWRNPNNKIGLVLHSQRKAHKGFVKGAFN